MPSDTPKIIFGNVSSDRGEPAIKFQNFDDLRKRYDLQTKIIIGTFATVAVTLVIMTATLVIDSFHFNSATYREYAVKLESNRQILDSNERLLKRSEEQQIDILRSLGEIRTMVEKSNKK